MGGVSVTWVEKAQFVGTDSSKHSVVMSSQDAENATGCKPSDLLLIALGGCISVDIVSILQKQRQQLKGLQIGVSGEQDSDPPWTFRGIHIAVTVRGQNLSQAAVERAVTLAEDKYCSVSATLRGTAKVTTSITIVED